MINFIYRSLVYSSQLLAKSYQLTAAKTEVVA